MTGLGQLYVLYIKIVKDCCTPIIKVFRYYRALIRYFTFLSNVIYQTPNVNSLLNELDLRKEDPPQIRCFAFERFSKRVMNLNPELIFFLQVLKLLMIA